MSDKSESRFDDERLRAAWQREITGRFDAIEVRLDRIEKRLERIEHRLGLVEEAKGG